MIKVLGVLALGFVAAQSAFAAGNVLVDQNGMTVYVFDKDSNGTSNCYGGCEKAWPPVKLADSDVVAAPYGSTTRKDGTRQLMYQGRPLYLYVGDEKPGDENGDGLGGIWHVVPAQD